MNIQQTEMSVVPAAAVFNLLPQNLEAVDAVDVVAAMAAVFPPGI